MFSSQRFLEESLRSCIYVTTVVLLLIFIIFLSSCASTPPIIDESLRDNALNGNAQAQYEIGEIYWKAAISGFGKPSYYEDAAPWFEMAANQGDTKAQYRLAMYYFYRKDYSQAFKWMQLPAQQGMAEAQYSLGIDYAQAWGTPQNLVLAYKWIALANEGGIQNAAGNLADTKWLIYKGKLTPDQIAEGQRLAAEHTAAYGKSSLILRQ